MLVKQPVLGDVIENPVLNLRRVTKFYEPELALGGVSLSELPDPMSYWDEPGSIVLTTALSLDHTSAPAMSEYVTRLLEGGVIGIGIAVGPHVLSGAPERLVKEAERLGLTVFEVPLSTRFIGVTQAIMDLKAKAKYESRITALGLQRDFSRAALRANGAQKIVAHLGEALDGWAALLAADGTPSRQSRSLRPDAETTIRAEVNRIAPRGNEVTSTISHEGETIAIYPVGLARKPAGYLAVGYNGNLGDAERSLLETAVAILSLHLERTRGEPQIQRNARRRRLTAALQGDEAGAMLLESVADLAPLSAIGEDLVVLVATSPQDAQVLVDQLDENLALDGCEISHIDGRVVLVVAVDRVESTLIELHGHGFRIGVAAACARAQLQAGYESASRAHESARRLAKDIVRAETGFGASILAMVPTQPLQNWADSSFAALKSSLGEATAADALDSLAAFLVANGSMSAAASALGVHRHTLRAHLMALENALEFSLSDPETRAGLWIALRLLGKV